jgi:hypothetical protein
MPPPPIKKRKGTGQIKIDVRGKKNKARNLADEEHHGPAQNSTTGIDVNMNDVAEPSVEVEHHTTVPPGDKVNHNGNGIPLPEMPAQNSTTGTDVDMNDVAEPSVEVEHHTTVPPGDKVNQNGNGIPLPEMPAGGTIDPTVPIIPICDKDDADEDLDQIRWVKGEPFPEMSWRPWWVVETEFKMPEKSAPPNSTDLNAWLDAHNRKDGSRLPYCRALGYKKNHMSSPRWMAGYLGFQTTEGFLTWLDRSGKYSPPSLSFVHISDL